MEEVKFEKDPKQRVWRLMKTERKTFEEIQRVEGEVVTLMHWLGETRKNFWEQIKSKRGIDEKTMLRVDMKEDKIQEV